jgi:hypothetical protein
MTKRKRTGTSCRAKHGYEPNGTIGGEFSLIYAVIWRHQAGTFDQGRRNLSPPCSLNCYQNERSKSSLDSEGRPSICLDRVGLYPARRLSSIFPLPRRSVQFPQ